MAKLKALPPRLDGLPPRFGPATRLEQERARHQRRYYEQPWRQWYALQAWKDLRLAVFKRDHWRCVMTGKLCVQKYPLPLSPVAHHTVPHKGDPELFWDIDNVVTVCKFWHDGEGQAMERAAEKLRGSPGHRF